jgi:hypothetical protein
MTVTASQKMTSGQAAVHLGVREWQLVSLYRRGLLPEPQRLGRLRAIDADDLPRIRSALVAAGYLPAAPDAGPPEEAQS